MPRLCHAQTPPKETPVPLKSCAFYKDKRFQTGFASLYDTDLQGQPTSTGEPYDTGQLTAASRTLPFNTRIRVTNRQNGRHVILRINDRGPFTPGRLIDISSAAAKVLHIQMDGTAPVRLEILCRPKAKPAAPHAKTGAG